MAKRITFTGDAEEDGGNLTNELDGASMDFGMSLEDYSVYLESLAIDLRRRAEQVRDEAGG